MKTIQLMYTITYKGQMLCAPSTDKQRVEEMLAEAREGLEGLELTAIQVRRLSA